MAVRSAWQVADSIRVRLLRRIAIDRPILEVESKSTIIRTLLGLLPDDAGCAQWNGQVLVAPARQMQSPRVAYARQLPKFVAGTVRENLQLGNESITEAEMLRAFKAVHLTPGASELAEGLGKMLESERQTPYLVDSGSGWPLCETGALYRCVSASVM
ncbi:hypothetical protein [Dermatophilus congolensis]|uniref:Cysteine/glutathione ABC transporter membrane /ATP-binding component n=2 Tax=Dermatophilus congolensis TaxID=1863 RepID=A0A239VNA9_9MICO|nr:hypothetical protein [Dermatophilus congolensis]MBO3129516.1 hypothetical protein [Dermatophilus congolensis]MBO3133992.1 hypothetical protein [Dermatophilus congolensis]MBO3136223.1 hypothetical protein [Dermatophilus congolensis]MBO3138469.1 hypothetical protein [Dermatophilus congolensis]MBO3140706.1 hypothetical protein [Dermatophilus congolensis]